MKRIGRCCLVIALLFTCVQYSCGEEPFNGKDLAGWKFKHDTGSKWKVGKASLVAGSPEKIKLDPGNELVNAEGGSVDIFTGTKYGDILLELEVMVPKGSNSGIYLLGEYEVQIFDSHGKKDKELGGGDMGAIYGASVPKVNACKAPGEWQKYVIDFRAPKFDAAGKKTANATFVKVTLNDQVIHENVEVKAPTLSSLTGKEAATGPLMLQGDHGPVAFRKLKITPR